MSVDDGKRTEKFAKVSSHCGNRHLRLFMIETDRLGFILLLGVDCAV